MGAFIQTAPLWVVSAAQGAFFGLTELALQGDSVVGAVLSGLLFGVWMHVFNRRVRARREAAMGEMSVGDKRIAIRASTAGPVPVDPEVRGAARRLAAHSLAQIQRQRSWGWIVWVGLIGLDVWLAFSRSPLWLLEGVLFGWLLVRQLRWPSRLQHRVELLS